MKKKELFRQIGIIICAVFLASGVVTGAFYYSAKKADAIIGIGPFGGVLVNSTKCDIWCGSIFGGRVWNVSLSPLGIIVPLYFSKDTTRVDYRQQNKGTFVLGISALDPRQALCWKFHLHWDGPECHFVPSLAHVTYYGSTNP
jgi:hypothetical protein